MSDTPPARTNWDERYATDDYVFGTEPNDFLRTAALAVPHGRVLCLAEGEGRNAVHLAERGWQVASVDLAPSGVTKTLRLAVERGVTVDAVVCDLAAFDLGVSCWSGIVSIFAHVPRPVRQDLHRRVVAALAPGGVFVLEAYTPTQVGRGTGGPPVAELTMQLADLRGELDGLEIIHGVETERSVVEGRGHTGMASVVQVIARRPTP